MELGALRAQVPSLAATMLKHGAAATDAAAAISEVYAAITARAANLAEQAMVSAGQGPAPVSWCVLLLGSGGRGESLLAPDQDNAIVHAGSSSEDDWFAAAGSHMADLLNDAGIPFCPGGVMASEERWRHGLTGWHNEIERWAASNDPLQRMMVDVFYDFVPVYGDRRLASDLRDHATTAAARSPEFLIRLCDQIRDVKMPVNWLGRFVTRAGRIELKFAGTLPLVTAARVLGLRAGSSETGTLARLKAAHSAGLGLDADTVDGLGRALNDLMEAILRQQIDDLAAGQTPSTRVDPRRLGGTPAHALKAHLKRIGGMHALAMTALRTGRRR